MTLTFHTAGTVLDPDPRRYIDNQDKQHQHQRHGPGLFDPLRVRLLGIFPQGQRQGIDRLVDNTPE